MSHDPRLDKRPQDAAEKIHQRPSVTPPVDIFESKDELLIIADLPGVVKEELTLHLDKGRLNIEARRPASTDGSTEAFDYKRVFAVPQGIDAERIAAELTSGVLRVHLPKSAALKPRQIAVRAG